MDTAVEEDGGAAEGEEVAGAAYFLAGAEGGYGHDVFHCVVCGAAEIAGDFGVERGVGILSSLGLGCSVRSFSAEVFG